MYGKLTAPGFQVKDKHVFITGGSSGLGLALAKRYARAGAKVSIIARDAKTLASATREIESWASSDTVAHPVFARPCDVTDMAAVSETITEANTFHGRVTDHVVCNAGHFEPSLLLEQDSSIYRKTMDINYFGTLHTVQAALPHMINTPLHAKEPKRRVIFVASLAALTTFIGYSSYASSKFAVRGLSEALRNELQLDGIEVSIFYPGKIQTPMIDREFPMKPAAASRLDSLSTAVTADTAAAALVNGIANGRYAITMGLLGMVARTTANGGTPRDHAVLEAVLLPLLALLQTPHQWYCDWVVRSAATKTPHRSERDEIV
jgi:NAD(P)-dependent dehydrogenase (short-subunit alcohol dehydrogenase family)